MTKVDKNIFKQILHQECYKIAINCFSLYMVPFSLTHNYQSLTFLPGQHIEMHKFLKSKVQKNIHFRYYKTNLLLILHSTQETYGVVTDDAQIINGLCGTPWHYPLHRGAL